MAISSDYLMVDKSNNNFYNKRSEHYEIEEMKRRYEKIIEHKQETINSLQERLLNLEEIEYALELEKKLEQAAKLLQEKDQVIRKLSGVDTKRELQSNFDKRINNINILHANELKAKDDLIEELRKQVESKNTEVESLNKIITELRENSKELFADTVTLSVEWKYATLRKKLQNNEKVVVGNSTLERNYIKEFENYIDTYNKSTQQLLKVILDESTKILSIKRIYEMF